jgi:hypothetical protein
LQQTAGIGRRPRRGCGWDEATPAIIIDELVSGEQKEAGAPMARMMTPITADNRAADIKMKLE